MEDEQHACDRDAAQAHVMRGNTFEVQCTLLKIFHATILHEQAVIEFLANASCVGDSVKSLSKRTFRAKRGIAPDEEPVCGARLLSTRFVVEWLSLMYEWDHLIHVETLSSTIDPPDPYPVSFLFVDVSIVHFTRPDLALHRWV